MSTTVIKLIAAIIMLGDHIGSVFGTDGWNLFPRSSMDLLRSIGRIAFPLFAFCCVNGYIHTHDKEKYFQRLVLFALISQIPYSLTFSTANRMAVTSSSVSWSVYYSVPIIIMSVLCALLYLYSEKKQENKDHSFIPVLFLTCLLSAFTIRINYIFVAASDELNVLYTLALGVVTMHTIDCLKDKEASALNKATMLIMNIVVVIFYGINADYGIGLMGLVLIIALYICHENKFLQALAVIIWAAVYYGIVIGTWEFAYMCIFAAIIILFYNGKKGAVGPKTKYLFYAFYPAHLLVLGIINIYLRLCS